MTTKRTPIRRALRPRITAEAIAAWKRCDRAALNDALGIPTWERSPLPLPEPLGGMSGPPSMPEAEALADPGWRQLCAWRDELFGLCGPPDAEPFVAKCTEGLKDREEMVEYYEGLLAAAPDDERLKEDLAEAEADADWYCRCLIFMESIEGLGFRLVFADEADDANSSPKEEPLAGEKLSPKERLEAQRAHLGKAIVRERGDKKPNGH